MFVGNVATLTKFKLGAQNNLSAIMRCNYTTPDGYRMSPPTPNETGSYGKLRSLTVIQLPRDLATVNAICLRTCVIMDSGFPDPVILLNAFQTCF